MAGGIGAVGAGVRGHPRTRRWIAHRVLLALVDAAAWIVAVVVATVLRYELDVAEALEGAVWEAALVAAAAQVVIGTLFQLYRGRLRIGTLEDAVNVSSAVAAVGVVTFAANLLPGEQLVPRSVPLIAVLVTLALTLTGRAVVRRRRERDDRPDGSSAQRVIVFGAGNEGQQLVRTMLSDRLAGYLPVALLDDDPDLRLRRFLGVSVRGTRADLSAIAADVGADLLVIAAREVHAPAVREIALAASEAELGVKVMPPLTEALRPWFRLADLQDVDIADLLGRRPVDIDLAAVAGYVTGHRVLVTGAGGSIGSELCRQLHGFSPAQLLMLDRDESALHATQLSIFGTALLDTPDVLLADIRDAATIERIFTDRRPEVVFHAAALKHLPLLEQYPEEAWESNVIGTANVLRAAALADVERFVNVSTDKAANPTSVLGRSKRVGERMVAHAATVHRGTYLSVRFGNVLGSRGSVLTTFAEQIANDTPVTVTHPEVTRFFMTIPEAVQLVVYAAAIGRRGEALILDMGTPVRIVDVARQLMGLAGRRASIVYTGLRRGEKLHEELLGRDEVDRRPVHPGVSHVDVPALDPALARAEAGSFGAATAMVRLTATEVPVASLDAARTPTLVVPSFTTGSTRVEETS